MAAISSITSTNRIGTTLWAASDTVKQFTYGGDDVRLTIMNVGDNPAVIALDVDLIATDPETEDWSLLFALDASGVTNSEAQRPGVIVLKAGMNFPLRYGTLSFYYGAETDAATMLHVVIED